MRINIYVNNNGTFTLNAFDNDGYMAGAISSAGGSGVKAIDAVQFIDEIRNREPENVKAFLMLDGQKAQLNLFSTREELIHTLNACVPHPIAA